jgi:hypothetical protein
MALEQIEEVGALHETLRPRPRAGLFAGALAVSAGLVRIDSPHALQEVIGVGSIYLGPARTVVIDTVAVAFQRPHRPWSTIPQCSCHWFLPVLRGIRGVLPAEPAVVAVSQSADAGGWQTGQQLFDRARPI